MNILITNSRLDGLGGAQSFVRDLGRGLQELGHSVVAYSCDPGDREVLRERGMIPTTDSLDDLPFRPDVIHGQHHLQTMAATAVLHGIPAIYHCHGAVWRECPPLFPRIYHYLAVSRTLANRMIIEMNLDPADVSVLLNTLEVGRFNEVRALPEVPARALFYNKMHGPDSPVVGAIREAASRVGIELDCVGRHFERMISDPERVLPTYDIVFASGRSAIDALAAGCAVVVLGRTSCGEMVVPENYGRLREVNFAIAVNSPPSSADMIEKELRRYSAVECGLVSRRLREEADSASGIRTLVGIYEDVIARHNRTPEDLPAERRAMAKYLRRLSPIFSITDSVLRENGGGMRPLRAGSVSQGDGPGCC